LVPFSGRVVKVSSKTPLNRELWVGIGFAFQHISKY